MPNVHKMYQAAQPLGAKEVLLWRSLQWLFFAIGLGLFLTLVFLPEIGVVAFWNILIPVAPLLFLLATGFWRNVCPLAAVAMFPHHLNWSKKRRIPLKWQGRLALASVVLLFLIVPARHLMLNNDGLATAAILVFLATLAFVGGLFFDVKSAWCSGLCPVHPVEKLYGQKVGFTPQNAHCGACHNCVMGCPDSTPSIAEQKPKERNTQAIAATLLTGGLPGFIWGWFHVPDCRSPIAEMGECLMAFGLPWATLVVTLVAYLLLRKLLPNGKESLLTSVFAAASISCYYWYRIPSLLGYGLFPEDGLLVDLTHILPLWSIMAAQVAAVAFFGWWLVLRNPEPSVWAIRPPFEVKRK